MTTALAPSRARVLVALGAAGLAVLALSQAGRFGASWSEALAAVRGLSWWWPPVFGAVWVAGLAVHTVLLTAALPGLTRRRALILNVAGNAVANVLPLGGAAGTAVNYGMVRGWGHSSADYVRFAVVSKSCDFVAKLMLPLPAVGGLLAVGGLSPARGGWVLLAVAGAGAAVGVVVVLALLGRASRVLRAVPPRVGGSWAVGVAERTAGLVRRRWVALVVGLGGYLALQGVLLWLCFTAVGLHLPLPTTFATLVALRLLALLAITPAGVGFVEAGTITVLVALRVDPTGALAGLLLYRAFVLLAEVPAGGLTIAWWATTRRRTPR
ncbi:lysylphosphatidylglycerol synthase transmembrane domain-containing protein [Cryptosporangium phraense]|uniref:UPF0104 family protein n=1 Tax=Cryptosporangium phraense TaxID=2593070 RepID=A0A545AKR1_9ACTN|nr:YbhN family protein [Cryptosporangium phraense]TQS41899.1 UPF0104 family protein [Cryptosporangium phraense]